jgi:hypothetical protein
VNVEFDSVKTCAWFPQNYSSLLKSKELKSYFFQNSTEFFGGGNGTICAVINQQRTWLFQKQKQNIFLCTNSKFLMD